LPKAHAAAVMLHRATAAAQSKGDKSAILTEISSQPQLQTLLTQIKKKKKVSKVQRFRRSITLTGTLEPLHACNNIYKMT
jgi:hypothetical protein